ncbi:MAG TPA: multiheme c-type cytochrome [Polyangiaceae bacterium]
MNRSLRLARHRGLLERHWPWLVCAVLGTLALGVVLVALGSGVLAEYSDFLSSTLRGYTPLGVVLGLASVALLAIVTLYSLRRRALQEHLPATLASWLWAHVYLGLFALVTACAHAGFGAFSLQLSTGKLLLASLVLLVGSGLVWRLVYAFVPRIAQQSVGNYSVRASEELAARSLVEIEKQVAGRSASVHELKRRLLDAPLSAGEFQQLSAAIPREEWPVASELSRLVQTHSELMARAHKQQRFTRLLQRWRVLHVPFVLVVLALLPLHVLLAYDVPARLVEPGAIPGVTLGGFEKADACERCHESIVRQWRTSMHARAMTSPLMIAQTNQVVARVFQGNAQDPTAKICVNCHGPLGATLTSSASLPLVAENLGDDTLVNEGVSCAVCHQWRGTSNTGGAGLASFATGLSAGRTYFGPIADPVANAFHRSEQSALFATPEELCRNCHAVQLDKNGDGQFVKGTDLVLQTLFDEWRDYAKAGGASCTACHMPVVAERRAAESASIPFEQDQEAPARTVHDHSFVGVDHPLDVPERDDPQREARAALLRRAATLELLPSSVVLDKEQLGFEVRVTNSGTGHYLPGGFAFVRQMWLEVSVTDAGGALRAASGVLGQHTDDLCDANILGDATNPMNELMVGCNGADPLLVNLQQQLVDRVEAQRDEQGAPVLDERQQVKLKKAEGAQEVVLQYLDGGPVARVRPFDKRPLTPLVPGETRAFAYRFAASAGSLAGGALKVRLLFRAVPPYMVRALARAQPAGETPQLAPLIGNLSVHEMASVTQALP